MVWIRSECRCARCRPDWIHRGWVCPGVLELRSLRGVDNVYDVIVAQTISRTHHLGILRLARDADPGFIQHYLSESGMLINYSLAVSLRSLSRWRWFVIGLLSNSS